MSTSHDESTLGSPFEADEPEPCGDTSDMPPCEECGAAEGEYCRPWCIADQANGIREPADDESRSFATDTPDGPATISIVSHEIDTVIYPADCGQHGEIRGDRFVLRSTVTGLPDMFTVVERSNTMVERGATNWWKFVTDDLTAEQFANWQEHRKPAAFMGERLAAWLSEY